MCKDEGGWGALLVVLWVLWAAAAGAEVRHLGTYVWVEDWPEFGGFSAIELAPDGAAFVALNDRGLLVEGALDRQDGTVRGVRVTDRTPLLTRDGTVMQPPRTDSEGLAWAPDGRLFISFEGVARVRVQAGLHGLPDLLPRAPAFDALQSNGSLEALALGPDGSLYVIPERSGRAGRPFAVFRFRDGEWDVAFDLARRGAFLPVGADVGPDGRLYVLERDFNGFAFASRVRRMALDGSGEEVVLETGFGVHDNLEGISVWRDVAGQLRLTLIADDNFRFFQETQIVDYVLD